MHCGLCGDVNAEVRPINIKARDLQQIATNIDKDYSEGDYYACRQCVDALAPFCEHSSLVTWVGFPCDECSALSAFNGPIDDMPEGIVCDECTPNLGTTYALADLEARGVWLCMDCYEERHYGHRQMQLQPILDQLANL